MSAVVSALLAFAAAGDVTGTGGSTDRLLLGVSAAAFTFVAALVAALASTSVAVSTSSSTISDPSSTESPSFTAMVTTLPA